MRMDFMGIALHSQCDCVISMKNLTSYFNPIHIFTSDLNCPLVALLVYFVSLFTLLLPCLETSCNE